MEGLIFGILRYLLNGSYRKFPYVHPESRASYCLLDR